MHSFKSSVSFSAVTARRHRWPKPHPVEYTPPPGGMEAAPQEVWVPSVALLHLRPAPGREGQESITPTFQWAVESRPQLWSRVCRAR